MKNSKYIILIVFIMILAGCSTIDCPLYNRVYSKYKLAGDVTTLTDTLTIKADLGDGMDSTIINKSVNTDSFELPMSYARDMDEFYFEMKDTNNVTCYDTIKVEKTNSPHFEAVDCNPLIFHTIKSIKYTKNKIDSIVINNKDVTYDATKSTFLIHFKSSTY